jgi:hypothetical protein
MGATNSVRSTLTVHPRPDRSTPPGPGAPRSDPHAQPGPWHRFGRRARRPFQPEAADSRRRRPPAAAASRGFAPPHPRPSSTPIGRDGPAPDRHEGIRIGQTHDQYASGRSGTLDRSRHSLTAAPGRTSTGHRPRGSSHGKAFATLCPPALQSQPTTARPHARAEAMRPRSLAPFRLIGAFHISRAQGRVRTSIRSDNRGAELPDPGLAEPGDAFSRHLRQPPSGSPRPAEGR